MMDKKNIELGIDFIYRYVSIEEVYVESIFCEIRFIFWNVVESIYVW